jgi:periplasmic protein TonB
MTTFARNPPADPFRGGLAGAIGLHLALAAILVGAALINPSSSDRWGEKSSSIGAIQASMVSAIPLPSKVPPVKNAVLTPENVSPAPVAPPKEAAAPPPQPTDILLKAKTPDKPPPKVAPTPTEAPPKHPQPIPDTPKAQTGDQATQLPQSVTQTSAGTATLTVQDRTFGNRYSYYTQIVGRMVAQNWYKQEIDPRTPLGRSTTIVFDIQRDGTPTNVHVKDRSGSPSLDASALHALQRVDGFGPLPSGDHITVEYTFDYLHP